MAVNPSSVTEAGISLREFALRAGDIHGKVVRSLAPLAKLPLEELMQRAEADLVKVRDRGLLTDPEMQHLRGALRVIHTDSSPRQKFHQVEVIFQQIKAAQMGPVAIMIAAIAVDSSRGMAERSEAAGTNIPHHAVVVAADVAGGIGGVLVGDEMCGLVCGVMGGVAGAAGLSMLADEYHH